MWRMLCTRPDLAFTVSMLRKFSSTPTTENLSAATYTLRYLRHTANLAIQYNASDSEATMPIGYTDSDFAGDPDDRKSTSGYVFMLPEAPLRGVLASSRLLLSQRWKPNT